MRVVGAVIAALAALAGVAAAITCVRQLAQRAVWDLKSRTLQKGTRFRNLTLGDAPVGKREKTKKRGLLPGKTRRETPLWAVESLGHLR